MYSVSHIGIVVQDSDRSIAFYTDILGCKQIEGYQDERVRLTFLQAGGQVIELVQYFQEPSAQRQAGVVDHIAFAVPDMEAAVAKLRQQQVKLLLPEPRQVGAKKIMFLSGPDGERLEFVQEMC